MEEIDWKLKSLKLVDPESDFLWALRSMETVEALLSICDSLNFL